MHSAVITGLLFGYWTAALPIPQQARFSNNCTPQHTYPLTRIPTPFESAILARRILHSENHGVASTVFPSSSHTSINHTGIEDDAQIWENRPSTVGGAPIGLPEYIADCEENGNPTMLALTISTTLKNARQNPNVSLTVTSHDSDGTEWRSPAAHPRFSLQGHIEPIDVSDTTKRKEVERCWIRRHPDSKPWWPGNRIHESYWARVVVEEIYWIGGFGDRAYIGWISLDDWKQAGEVLNKERIHDTHDRCINGETH